MMHGVPRLERLGRCDDIALDTWQQSRVFVFALSSGRLLCALGFDHFGLRILKIVLLEDSTIIKVLTVGHFLRVTVNVLLVVVVRIVR